MLASERSKLAPSFPAHERLKARPVEGVILVEVVDDQQQSTESLVCAVF